MSRSTARSECQKRAGPTKKQHSVGRNPQKNNNNNIRYTPFISPASFENSPMISLTNYHQETRLTLTAL